MYVQNELIFFRVDRFPFLIPSKRYIFSSPTAVAFNAFSVYTFIFLPFRFVSFIYISFFHNQNKTTTNGMEPSLVLSVKLRSTVFDVAQLFRPANSRQRRHCDIRTQTFTFPEFLIKYVYYSIATINAIVFPTTATKKSKKTNTN